MFCACGPLGPCATSKLTFWFSLSVLKPLPWIAEKCAKRSLPPSSGVMKPKPLESLNHLTVPVLMSVFPNDKFLKRLAPLRGHCKMEVKALVDPRKRLQWTNDFEALSTAGV